MKTVHITYCPHLSSLSDWKEQAAYLQDKLEAEAIDHINWEEYAYKPEVAFRVAWYEQQLVLLFEVKEKAVRATQLEYHSPVYEDSCVEFFMQHEGESIYRNFEFNCIGTALAAIRKSRSECTHLSTELMDSLRIRASLSKEDTTKEGPYHWLLWVEIPFALLGMKDDESPQGKSIRANCYKCGDKTAQPHYLSWSPIHTEEPNFHCPEFFGRMVFA